MELPLLPLRHLAPSPSSTTPTNSSLYRSPTCTVAPLSVPLAAKKRFTCRCCSDASPRQPREGRRWVAALLAATAGIGVAGGEASAVSTSRRALKSAKIPESDFTTLPNGLKYYDIKPYGFDVGNSGSGNVLKGLDLGVEGMKAGGQRLLIVPPELAYGKRGIQEIPPNATIELDVELLSVKQNAFGTAVKIVEG